MEDELNAFRYRGYYEFNGPTPGAPLRTLKSIDEIADALDGFARDLCYFLEDRDAQIVEDAASRTPNAVELVVSTTHSREETDKCVARCLASFDLYGDRL